MKKMTCKEMGGPCEEAMMGETAEEMMKKGKEHLEGMVDDDHNDLRMKMENSTKEEKKMMKKDMEKKFEAAPDAM